MSLVSTRQLVESAVATAAAVPAFNILSIEHAEAVAWAADRTGVGLLMQISENAIRYHNGFAPLLAACRALCLASATPIGIHLDHIEDEALAYSLIDAISATGASSIMFDASRHPYEMNVQSTARFVTAARRAGIWVEAELGEIGGKRGAHTPGVRTDPTEAELFVASTGVDMLAVAVGSSHAMTQQRANLDLPLIRTLSEALPVPLVLHGSSGVPLSLLADAVAAGIRKVNVGTALGVVATRELRKELSANPRSVDLREYSASSRNSVTDLVAELAAVIGQPSYVDEQNSNS